MFTEIDEGKGLVRQYWHDIRHRVAKVEPTFAALIDELSPDKSYPLYLAYYPYGEQIGKKDACYLPKPELGTFKFIEPDIPKKLMDELGYGADSLPMGIILDKKFEWYIDLPNEKTSIPWVIYTPGMFFPVPIVLSMGQSCRRYAPNGILNAICGVRSAFLLPNIGCAIHHANLQRDYNIQLPAPKALYEQFNIFKEVSDKKILENNWRGCVVYFSEMWLSTLKNDPKWSRLKMYLYEKAWDIYQYARNKVYYDITFSMLLQKRNLKPNPYLTDIAKYLFSVVAGAYPGYVPASNEDSLPVGLIQKAYVESYGLKKYLPSVMQPEHFYYETHKKPVYYSLQNRSTHIFSPQSRKLSSTLSEVRELAYIIKAFKEELVKPETLCSDTVFSFIAEHIDFEYFHNKPDQHNIIQSSKKLPELDVRFAKEAHQYYAPNAVFSADAPFVRGCVSMSIDE